MTYTILRSRRKTISICVHRDGRIEVRAPMRVSETVIRDFVAQKEAWIERKLKELESARDSVREQMGKLPYLGRWCEIGASIARPYVENGAYYLPLENRTAALDALLHTLARDYIIPRTAALAAQYGFTYTNIHITSARTRFGSCSGKNSLNFTKYLVMYDPACIDYVILHELCHTVHHDHSAAFYAELARVCPGHREIRARMRSMMFLGDAVREIKSFQQAETNLQTSEMQ